MTSLAELNRDLERALQGGDLDQVASVRRAISAQFPDAEEGAEASYKLGLDALFRGRDLEAAAEHLRGAAKAKSARWSHPARLSLGLVLLRQKKPQQAVFELRRVAGLRPPTLLAAQAAGFLEIALREGKQAKEAEKARAQLFELLGAVAGGSDAEEAAHAHLLLGLEHKFDGRRQEAKRHLAQAAESALLPAEERARAAAALKEV